MVGVALKIRSRRAETGSSQSGLVVTESWETFVVRIENDKCLAADRRRARAIAPYRQRSRQGVKLRSSISVLLGMSFTLVMLAYSMSNMDILAKGRSRMMARSMRMVPP